VPGCAQAASANNTSDIITTMIAMLSAERFVPITISFDDIHDVPLY
jgi:hypothetical protein